ncbi:hypothetical protein JBKA6_0841 [Ichthyobacterium seriolicida]|uniref:Uncharacterized protein n=1 Tax=Ichthyobacterium seriolicida TaxID=242600 RepID=A0A1J1E6A7_9FLAO|nr:hypothetical protein JBKA6_0841 [Ichthyobacterium seriolicida]
MKIYLINENLKDTLMIKKTMRCIDSGEKIKKMGSIIFLYIF